MSIKRCIRKIIKYIDFSKIILSVILIIFVFFSIFFISYFFINNKSNIQKSIYSNNDYIQNLNSTKVSNYNNKNMSSNESSENIENKKILYRLYENCDGFLTIPTLNIYCAPISEGTSQSVMQNYIGHFSNTSYDNGNIGLASHNRGSGATYFKELYKLKEGDYILYTYKNITSKYKVNKVVVISSYDWSYLENTSDNKITLITCINDKPEFRLCVQAIQI